MCPRLLERCMVTSNRDGVGKRIRGSGKVVGASNRGQWVKQRRGAAERGSRGGGMHPRPLEHCLAMPNGDWVGETNQRG